MILIIVKLIGSLECLILIINIDINAGFPKANHNSVLNLAIFINYKFFLYLYKSC